MVEAADEAEPRRRARALGIRIGQYPPGRFNAITDVPGVRVGHSTIIRGEGALIRVRARCAAA